MSRTIKRATRCSYSLTRLGLVTVELVLSIAAVCGRPCYEGSAFDLCYFASAITDEDMYADYKGLYGQYDEIEGRKRQPHHIMRRSEIVDTEDHKNGTVDDTDIVDREDHITQHLSELLVNTDSEITSLQASDVEETKEDSGSLNKEDAFYSFLVRQEGYMEIGDTWSLPAKTII